MADEHAVDQVDPTGEGAELRALLALQDADLHIDQLAHRRAHPPEQARIDEIARELAARDAQIRAVEEERSGFEGHAAELEREVEAIRERRAAIEARSRSDAAGSFRDQEAMSHELGALTDRMVTLEESELELLEAIEALEARLSALRTERVPLELATEELRRAVEETGAVLDAELVAARGARGALAAAVPETLLGEYERLRARNGGIGAARLEHGACSGCNLTIPSTELDRMRHAPAGTLFHCDQCGRILVRV